MTRQLHTAEGAPQYILLMSEIHGLIPIRISEKYRATTGNSSQRQLHLWVS